MSSIALQTNIKGEPITIEDRYLKVKEVAEICGMARATIYRAMERNQFPLQRQITEGRVGWLKSDIAEYMRVGFVGFSLIYSNKIKQQRIDNKVALAQPAA